VASVIIELNQAEEQQRLNLRRWSEILNDPDLARFPGRVQTDRHGHVVMSPPAAPHHGSLQSEISYWLRTLMPNGRTITECPISTVDGVKAADVAWASPDCLDRLGSFACFREAPEICVEIMSPSNSDREIREKMALYFAAGAAEVWLCAESGHLSFFGKGQEMAHSELCPRFPKQVQTLGSDR
jgi:hypothetical protein